MGRIGGAWERWWEAPLSSQLARPPGILFHLPLAVPVGALLWACSVPGVDWFLAYVAVLGLGGFGLAWLVRLVAHAWARRLGRRPGAPTRLAVFPISLALAAGLVWGQVPLRARWAHAKGAFEAHVAVAPPAGAPEGPHAADVPDRLGSYGIVGVDRVGDGIVFHEATGTFFGFAGFAHLPSGPSPELDRRFDELELRPLGDGWYAWSAGW